MIIIDSDVLIWILRGNKHVKKKFDEYVIQSNGLIYITAVQIAEIMAGLKQNEKTDTEIFLNSLHCLDIDFKAGQLAGLYMNKYAKSHNITLADSLIAAAAYINKLKIWTLNRKHYPMLDIKDLL